MSISLPNIAVIIPTLNEERFIDICLQSVFEQTYPTELMDIMIVDGGSSDKTVAIVQQWASTHPNLRLLSNPKRIQSIAFNIGCQSSTAPYVIRLDAHARYHSEYMRLCIQHLLNNPKIGNVGGVWDIMPQNDSLIASANAILNKSRFGIGGAAYRVQRKPMEVDTVPFGAFPRYVIEEIGGMREDLVRAEDNEYNSRIRKAGYIVFLDPAIQSTYFARPTIRESMKQMYANGLSIGILYHIDKTAIGVRHFIPFCFVFSLIFCLLLGCFVHIIGFAGVLVLCLYGICSVIASTILSYRYGRRFLFILPIIFFCVHIAYGWGTLVGLVQTKYK